MPYPRLCIYSFPFYCQRKFTNHIIILIKKNLIILFKDSLKMANVGQSLRFGTSLLERKDSFWTCFLDLNKIGFILELNNTYFCNLFWIQVRQMKAYCTTSLYSFSVQNNWRLIILQGEWKQQYCQKSCVMYYMLRKIFWDFCLSYNSLLLKIWFPSSNSNFEGLWLWLERSCISGWSWLCFPWQSSTWWIVV